MAAILGYGEVFDRGNLLRQQQISVEEVGQIVAGNL